MIHIYFILLNHLKLFYFIRYKPKTKLIITLKLKNSVLKWRPLFLRGTNSKRW